VSPVVALTVVAFYGPKPDALSALIGAVQHALGTALGAAFRPRPMDDVHATIVGLEDAPGHADDVAAFSCERRRSISSSVVSRPGTPPCSAAAYPSTSAPSCSAEGRRS
jgi:hypothetical protein